MDPRHGSLPITNTHDEDSPEGSFVRALKDITFGSIAGIVSELFEYPFDLAKTRLQSQVLDESARFTGPWDCLVQTWRDEGIRGLYRGLPMPLVGAMAETAALFLAYSEIQDLLRYATGRPKSSDLSIPQLGLAAGGAGLITSFILTPIELVKCKMQVQMLNAPIHPPAVSSVLSPSILSPSVISASTITAPMRLPQASRTQVANSIRQTLPGPFKIVASIIRTSGPRGLWLGHTGTMFRESGGTATWFALKETIASTLLARKSRSSSSRDQEQAAEGHLAPWESALSGAVAGGACVAAFYPADTIKSAIQTAEELHPSAHGSRQMATPTFWGTGRAMWRARGLRGLYAGCGMTTLRALPSSGIVFVVYDGLTQHFGT
ncbi:hypothetical protein PLICRDRAFT_51379 [Plicaturopsis crispa FD-325 SS-3]|nr:hypothetical protein PLICRDRAFT_51379 [Plicaturopsis crispa FD-325 SS-3]